MTGLLDWARCVRTSAVMLLVVPLLACSDGAKRGDPNAGSGASAGSMMLDPMAGGAAATTGGLAAGGVGGSAGVGDSGGGGASGAVSDAGDTLDASDPSTESDASSAAVSSCAGQLENTACAPAGDSTRYGLCLRGACIAGSCGDQTCSPSAPYFPLPTRAARTFEREGASEPIVRDALTGLVWQGCLVGTTGPDCSGEPTPLTFSDAIAFCEDLRWASYEDWYLPDIFALGSIVRLGEDPPTDPALGPVGRGELWSSTLHSESGGFTDAMKISGLLGPGVGGLFVTHEYTGLTFPLRCVRRSVAMGSHSGQRFLESEPVAAHAVVVDSATQRMWKKCPAGADGCGGGALSGDVGDDLDETAADAYCAALDFAGHDDWRVPEVWEAYSLVDIQQLGIGHNPGVIYALTIMTSSPQPHELDLMVGVTYGLPDVSRHRKGVCLRDK